MTKLSMSKWLMTGSVLLFAFACQSPTNHSGPNNQRSPCQKDTCPPPPPKPCCNPPAPKPCCNPPAPKPCCNPPAPPKPCCPKPCCPTSQNDENSSAQEAEKASAVIETKTAVEEPVAEKGQTAAPDSQNKVQTANSEAKSEPNNEAKAEIKSESAETPSKQIQASSEKTSAPAETAQK